MATTICPECRQSVPSGARACPNCGSQNPGASLAGAALAVSVFLPGIIGLILGLVSRSKSLAAGWPLLGKAKAAIVIGAIGILLNIILFVMILQGY